MISTGVGNTTAQQVISNTKLDTVNTSIGTTNTELTTTNTELVTINTTLGSPAQVIPAVTMTHTLVTTGNVSSTALASNSSAKYRLFINSDTADTITIAANIAAVAGTQILIQPKEQFEMSRVKGNMDTRQINCIGGAGMPVLLITEGV